MAEQNISKEEFWKTLRNPTERKCGNCKHYSSFRDVPSGDYRSCGALPVGVSLSQECLLKDMFLWEWTGMR